MYYVHGEKVWFDPPKGGELFRAGINFGPDDARRQLIVQMSKTTIHSAPIGGDYDLAERVAVGVLEREAGGACANDSSPAVKGYQPGEPTHPSLTAWVKTLRGPQRPEDIAPWTEFVESVAVEARS